MALSPMMQQYFKIKEQYSDAILLFRLGDFYEMFFDDAKTASKELELVLTGRDCGLEERAPMCGVPFHSADSYIAKLVSRGYKVAICEQMEDPATAKGIVKRDIIRVLSPGTVIESSMLDESKNNYLACVYKQDGETSLCFTDISTGEIHITSFINDDNKVLNELSRFEPSEIIINQDATSDKGLKAYLLRNEITVETLENEFDYNSCVSLITKHFNCVSLEEINLNPSKCVACALGGTLFYLKNAQRADLSNLREIDFYSDEKFMHLDFSARRNLEITETMRDREKRGSLLWVIDKTKTAMGKRRLRSFVERPLMNTVEIDRRLNAVEELFDNTQLRTDLIENLTGIYDIERLMTRIVYGTANAKELLSLSSALTTLPDIKERLSGAESQLLNEICNNLDTLSDIKQLIDNAIREDAPFSVREGGMIKDGFNGELDELRELVSGGKGFISDLEAREQEKTGIKKLRIGYNRVFGYYIEVLNSYKELVPEDYIRKQTLSNCERYITDELKQLESKVLSAQERIVSLEFELFSQVRKTIANELARTQKTANAIANIDAVCSLATVAVLNNYTRPTVNNSDTISITEGRHPVIEKILSDVPFVPNDTILNCSTDRVSVITGPNMAGKSTYMRQVALIVLLAQIGSFVPAKSANIGVVDAIFTRVGSSDDLSSGQSTFMVEMKEVADILINATKNSLIIFDEIGRGTSTYDGMSIARAVIEFSADKKKLGAKTLFATHYHELTELEEIIDGVKNYNIAVKKRGDDITFLRRIVRGPADGSYGIEVAKLAGVPDSVVKRAKTVLKALEENGSYTPSQKVVEDISEDEQQFTFEINSNQAIIDQIKNIDVNTLTPIEALSILYDLNKKANS